MMMRLIRLLLFYAFDWKPSASSLWRREEERKVDDLDEGEEGEDRRGRSVGI